MGAVTLGEFFALLPQLGGYGGLAFLVWLLVFDKRLMLRSDHTDALTEQRAGSDRDLAERDHQIARLQQESDGWRDIALRGAGILEQAAPFLSSSRKAGQQ